MGFSKTVEEALLACKITYFGGSFLTIFLMMLACDACKIKLKKIVRVIMYSLNLAIFLLSLTAGYTNWFYRECHIEKVNGITILVKEYGPAHILFLVMMYGYLLAGIIMLIYSIIRRKKLVYRNILLLLAIYLVTVLCYVLGRKLLGGLDPVTVAYSISSMILLFVTYNTSMYNFDEALLASMEKQDYQGFMLFDRKYRYLDCNDVAVKFIPSLKDQQLMRKLNDGDNETLHAVNNLIMSYDGKTEKISISSEGQDIELSAQYLYKGNNIRGFIVRIIDDSKQQEYIRQLDLISKNKSNFLSNVSHEIRTPLNAILGMNEMILRENADGRIQDYALNIAASGQTLLQLINDVLDLSKIESGKFEVIPTTYSLADIIYELESMVRPIIKKDDLSLIIDVDESLPGKLYGDAIRIKQMATNILTNAVKYTEKGTINFNVRGEIKDDICILNMSVKDTGRGIKENDIDNLFNAFERVDQLKNSGIEGTGLGLAITKKFALMMDGDITVQSTYGEGSTFSIVVPQKVVSSEPIGDYSKNRHEHVREEYTVSFIAPDAKVLAVDDIEMNLSVIELLLQDTQIQISTCNSGKDCLEMVKEEKFDLILLDHMMPDLDGVETLKIIKDNHYGDDTPIVALTANADVNAKSEYINYGFSDYLSKPIDPGMLEKLVYSVLPKEKIIEQ